MAGDPSPVLAVELERDRSARPAIDQILDRNYPQVLRDWGGPMLLVGITYDRKTKAHACHIEKLSDLERKQS